MRKIRITDAGEKGAKTTSITIDKTTGKLADISTTSTTQAKGKPLSPQYTKSVSDDIAKAK